MSRHPGLYQWTQAVASRFPHLSRPQAAVLALYSLGLVLAHSCALSAVALAVAALGGRAANTCRQRLREFYREAAAKRGRGRRDLDPAACFAPLLGWVLSGWGCRRVALALDATYLADRFIVLAVGVLYRGCAVPVAWKVLAADQKGGWNDHWAALLGGLRDRLPAGWEVLVLCDRGLESRALFAAVVALGWHPLLRAKGAGHFRPDGWHKSYPMRRLLRPGGRWRGRGTAYTKPGARLACTLLACWEEGHAEAWLVLTDLDPQAADAAWYGWRCWVEVAFKVAKRGGWQWQRTRMADPARAERLWVVLAVATLWLVEVGGAADAAVPAETVPAVGRAPARGRPPRRHGVFARGLALLRAGLSRGELPTGRFVPEDWPAVPDWQNSLTEQDVQAG